MHTKQKATKVVKRIREILNGKKKGRNQYARNYLTCGGGEAVRICKHTCEWG